MRDVFSNSNPWNRPVRLSGYQVSQDELQSGFIALPTDLLEAPITTRVENCEAEYTEANPPPKVISGQEGKNDCHDT